MSSVPSFSPATAQAIAGLVQRIVRKAEDAGWTNRGERTDSGDEFALAIGDNLAKGIAGLALLGLGEAEALVRAERMVDRAEAAPTFEAFAAELDSVGIDPTTPTETPTAVGTTEVGAIDRDQPARGASGAAGRAASAAAEQRLQAPTRPPGPTDGPTTTSTQQATTPTRPPAPSGGPTTASHGSVVLGDASGSPSAGPRPAPANASYSRTIAPIYAACVLVGAAAGALAGFSAGGTQTLAMGLTAGISFGVAAGLLAHGLIAALRTRSRRHRPE
jgi:hypothetical protein